MIAGRDQLKAREFAALPNFEASTQHEYHIVSEQDMREAANKLDAANRDSSATVPPVKRERAAGMKQIS